ncbi:MAG: SPFH domain-containing protein [Verrucomicrobia bacterium]|nr:SPFH domain-containing protein [Verrucomicrobiota bacterium]
MSNEPNWTRPPPVPPRMGNSGQRVNLTLKGVLGYFCFLLLAVIPGFIWFGCRIEPGPGELAILTRKTGNDLHPGDILALRPGDKGIQTNVLGEGRYFLNPYTWDWAIAQITDIPAGRLGVQTRLFGDDLPPGEIMATETSRGILSEVLMPGRYRINPYAYNVELFDALTIKPGNVGVQTFLVGKDVLSTPDWAGNGDRFLVVEGAKGVVPVALDPGTYYLNPYVVSVSEVNLQGQRFEMSGADVISFLTLDGFTVNVEGTLEWAIQRDSAALLTQRVGDIDDILLKIILPRARGFSRIEGSKHPAIDFIVGENRQAFQNNLEEHLKEKCSPWGVEVRSVLIRKITPPDEIASINRDREIAVQDSNKFSQQIEQAKSKAELGKQEMLAVQNKEKVDADTLRIRAVINAEQGQAVQIIAAEKDRDVAKVQFDAATFHAQAVLLEAEGKRDAIRVRNEAEAQVLNAQVQAFGTGMNFARYVLYQQLAPQIESVLTSDDPRGLGGIFTPFLPNSGEVTK